MPAAGRLPPSAGLLLQGAPRRGPPGGDGLSEGERVLAVSGPYDFDETLRFLPFGPYDPTCRRAAGTLWKAGRTPDGPVTLHLEREGAEVRARAFGPGAAWALERVPQLLGLHDDPAAFAPSDGRLASLARRWRGLRLSRSPWVAEGLAEYVLQQRVRFRDAMRAQRRLVNRLAAAAPGPPGLRLPLSPEDWLSLQDHDFRRVEIDSQRARTLRAVAHHARRVDAAFAATPSQARALLSAVPGCGPWTVEITLGFILGDPDVVPTGDLHLPHELAWVLAGEARGSDARMLELLSPFAGQRFRVLRLLLAAGRIHLGRGGRRGP